MNSKILPDRQQNEIALRCRTYNQNHSAEQPIQQDTHCNPFVLVDLGNGQICNLNKPSYPPLLDICLVNKKHILPIYLQ